LVARPLASLVALLLATSALCAGPVQSGPQAGEQVPGPFQPLHVNGPEAGKKACLYCAYGARPVVMVFARDLSPAVLGFVMQLDAALSANAERSLCGCVIVCSDDESLPGRLGSWCQQANIRNVTLAFMPSAGPAAYRLAPEAGVTALLYAHHKVESNHGLRTGEFTEQNGAGILADLPKILSAQ
jgi:hypothetical protein